MTDAFQEQKKLPEQKEFQEGVHSFAQNFFEKIKNTPRDQMQQRSFYYREVMAELARIVGDEKDWELGHYTVRIQQAARIYFDELGKFIRKHDGNLERMHRMPYGQQRYEHVIGKIHAATESGSPGVMDALSVEDRFEIAAQFSRTPGLDGQFEEDAVASLVYTFTFAKGDYSEKLINAQLERTIQGSVAEQLSFIELLHKIATHAIGQGYDHDYKNPQAAIKALQLLETRTLFPLVRLSAQYAGTSLTEELHEEIHGEILHAGFVNEISDIRKKTVAEDARLMKEYSFSVELGRGEHVRRISKDYAGLFSARGRLELLAPRPHADEKKELLFVDASRVMSEPAILPFGTEKSIDESLYLFEQLQSPLIRRALENFFGEPFIKISLRNQIQLLNFVSTQNEEVLGRIRAQLEKPEFPKKVFLDAFFSCAANQELGMELMKFAEENLPADVELVCGAYNKLTSAIDSVEYEAKIFFTTVEKKVDTRKVVQEFVKRGADIFQRSLKKHESAVTEFESVRADVMMFASIFKTAVKSGEVHELSEVNGLDMQAWQQEDLTQTDKDSMIGIAAGNWIVRGAVGEQVVAGLREKLQQSDASEWYILKKEGEIVSFVRFENLKSDDGRLHEYAGSFNVHPQYRGSAVGETMIREALNKEADRAVLHATMDPRIDVGVRYVEDTGFFVMGVADNYLGSAESFFEITCDRSAHKKFQTRSWSIDKIIQLGRTAESIESQIAREEIVVLNITRNAGEEIAFVEGARTALRAGYVGTRYIADPNNEATRYMVFEKLLTAE